MINLILCSKKHQPKKKGSPHRSRAATTGGTPMSPYENFGNDIDTQLGPNKNGSNRNKGKNKDKDKDKKQSLMKVAETQEEGPDSPVGQKKKTGSKPKDDVVMEETQKEENQNEPEKKDEKPPTGSKSPDNGMKTAAPQPPAGPAPASAATAAQLPKETKTNIEQVNAQYPPTTTAPDKTGKPEEKKPDTNKGTNQLGKPSRGENNSTFDDIKSDWKTESQKKDVAAAEPKKTKDKSELKLAATKESEMQIEMPPPDDKK